MSSYRDDRLDGEEMPSSGVLTHTLRLAVAVVATGLVVMFVLDAGDDSGEAGGSLPVTAVRDVTPAPNKPAASGGYSEVVLRAGAHGHFMVEASVNGEPLRFMVDTGASSIFLTPADAARLGWTPGRLTFSERYDTAAGEVRAAPVTLRSLRIGQLELYDLQASVSETPGAVSLLGMNFLQRLEGYQVRGDTLILSY